MQLRNRKCRFQHQPDIHVVINHKFSGFVVACCPDIARSSTRAGMHALQHGLGHHRHAITVWVRQTHLHAIMWVRPTHRHAIMLWVRPTHRHDIIILWVSFWQYITMLSCCEFDNTLPCFDNTSPCYHVVSLWSPNEDFGRPNKRFGPCFQSTFHIREYSIWATDHWKVLWKHGPKRLFGLPKSSFGDHRV